MRRMRWQILIVLLALVAIGVLLVGQQPTLLPILPEVQPATGGVYSEGLVGTLGRLNPILDMYNPTDRDIDRLLYSGLIRFDARGLPQEDLVQAMGISRDGLFYNFSLRQDAVWHDGAPLTSEDVIFTIELMRSEDLPVPEDVRALWETVEVEALDDQTLQFRLPEPYAPFLDYLTFGILPKHLLGRLSPAELVDDPFNLEPVGSGPYRFEQLLVEDGQITGLILSAFDEYYGEKAFIETLVFHYFPDAQSALAAYQAGEIQGISQVSPEILSSVLKEDGLRLHTGRQPQMTLILLNLDDPEAPFFQETAVRRALLMGLNRQKMIDTLLGGQAILADGPIFPGSWAYYDGIERLNYDPEGAIELLKEAEYTIPAAGGAVREKEGQRLTFELLYPEGSEYAALAEVIAGDWERIGVDANPQPVPYADLVSAYLEPRAYQAALVDLNLARSPDPDPYPFWHQTQKTGGQNYSSWDDHQASEYLEQARIIDDIAERTRLYRNFQVRFASEMPALPLFYPVYTYAIDEQVQGVTMGPLFDTSDRFATISSWFLVAERQVDAANAAALEGQATPPQEATPTTSP
jgi:peptide/nickel transport system substrate-binding protein